MHKIVMLLALVHKSKQCKDNSNTTKAVKVTSMHYMHMLVLEDHMIPSITSAATSAILLITLIAVKLIEVVELPDGVVGDEVGDADVGDADVGGEGVEQSSWVMILSLDGVDSTRRFDACSNAKPCISVPLNRYRKVMLGIITLPVRYPLHCIRGTLVISTLSSVASTRLKLIGMSMEISANRDVMIVTLVTTPAKQYYMTTVAVSATYYLDTRLHTIEFILCK